MNISKLPMQQKPRKAMDRLLGRAALVSGGANGVGAASCRLFAQEGASVCIVDRDKDAGMALEAENPGDRSRGVFHQC